MTKKKTGKPFTPKKASGPIATIGWYAPFLRALRDSPNVTAAARIANISRAVVYERRKTDPVFAQAIEDAKKEGIEMLEAEAMRRAFEGTNEPIYYKGKKIDTIKKYSDTLAIFLLKAHKPEKYRDRYEVKIASWQDDIVQSIKDGTIGTKDVREAFPDIAEQLLLRAGK